MQNLFRIGNYAWPYRRRVVLSVLCALFVSLFWSLNLSITFPIVRVLFEGDDLHANVDREIAELKTEIQGYQSVLAGLAESEISQRARYQRRLNDASQILLTKQWLKDLVLPWVPGDKFQTVMLILGLVVFASLLKGMFVYLQENLVGGLVNAASNDIRTDVFSSAIRLDTQSLQSLGTSNLTSRLTNDVGEMSLGLRLFGSDLIREPLKAFGCIAVAFYVNWRLTLVGMLVLPLIGLLFHRSGK